MRLKPSKEKRTFINSVKDIYSISHSVCPVSVSVDINGCVVLENFRRIISYDKNMIAMETDIKTVYIYGENIRVTACNRYSASVCGDIQKIEIFPRR
ncbi:MAG: YabP/YqfC family sporulation protein [Oscillospiraceae bacterium]|nr:YabP/YqfC family sporulation protein [Oscillospiraceae bacterium]